MAFLEVPLSNGAAPYQQRVVLDDVVYVLKFRWNRRMELWTVDILDADEVVLLAGVPVVAEYPLTYKFAARIEDLFLGQLLTVDETGQDRPPDLDTAGIDVKMLYVEAA